MPEQTNRSAPVVHLPEKPNLDWLRKQAKTHLAELRKTTPTAKLAEAQFDLARQYGFSSWRALKAHVESLNIEGKLVTAARTGDVEALKVLLDQYPEKLQIRIPPYDWTLLHEAARNGHLPAVRLLVDRGLGVNTREKGDNTYAMHWAAAEGHLDVVRFLADVGGDVIGHGDDHEWEVIGWAASQDDERHRAVADFLISRGARHNLFSAILFNRGDEIRRLVGEDPSLLTRPMSKYENHPPLHFAVRMNRPKIVSLLLELGADPLATDPQGFPAVACALSQDADRALVETVTKSVTANGTSSNKPITPTEFISVLAMHAWKIASQLLRDNPGLLRAAGSGALHLMAKRGDAEAVAWLLKNGADPNARWSHWDSDVTPLHLAVLGNHVLGNHANVVDLLIAAGADPTIRDTKHDSDAIGWAEFFKRPDIVEKLTEALAKRT